jgi:hypothetical protein
MVKRFDAQVSPFGNFVILTFGFVSAYFIKSGDISISNLTIGQKKMRLLSISYGGIVKKLSDNYPVAAPVGSLA